jgi:L-aspartate oxidase
MVGGETLQSSLQRTEALIIGTGVAGLASALKLAETRNVIIVAKCEVHHTNTAMAQGGIASVVATNDHFNQHIEDTLLAGAGLCQPEIVRKVVETGPARIAELEAWGVKFDTVTNPETQDKSLNREGGHSQRRILHVQDHTGIAIHQALIQQVQSHPNIRVVESMIAIDLITRHQGPSLTTGQDQCLGCHFLDIRQHHFVSIYAPLTVLATGGAGKTYLYTSNWEGATGDGIAMAYRAGCRVSNMEFMQFHPTCLYHQQARNFLISEALRGEGAELVNQNMRKFAYDKDPAGPLAPRDRVARAIDAEMKKSGADCVYLDIRHKGRDFLKSAFPNIYERCLSLGFDLATDLLPVVPAAHYLCGGVLTDEFGRTDLPGLFAIGECANTGLHGANRLASNSLLECLAFAHFSSEYIATHPEEFPTPAAKALNLPLTLNKEDEDERMLISHLWDEVRTSMWNYVGIVRSNKRLLRALTRIRNIENEIDEYYQNFEVHSDLIELKNLATVARLTIECALQRKSSVGTHYNVDAPPANLGTEPALNTIFPNSLH